MDEYQQQNNSSAQHEEQQTQPPIQQAGQQYQEYAENQQYASNPQPPVQQYYTYIPYGFTPETFAEKKELRRRARIVGVPSLIMFAIMFLWAQVFYMIMGRFGFSATDAYEVISDPAILQGVQVILSMLMFTVPFALAVRITGWRISDVVPFERPKKGLILPFFFFGLGFCAFANIAVSTAGGIFESFGIDYSVDLGTNPDGVFGFLLMILSTAVVPGLVEEFACRGVVLGSLRKFGDAFAVLVSSILFGAMHGNFDQMPFAFLVGLILGYIRIKTGSLWVCCLVHACNNLVSVFFTYLFNGVSGAAQNAIYAIFLIGCLLVGLVGVLLLKNRKTDVYTFDKPTNACTEKQKYQWFFTSPFIIIFLAICLIEAMVYFF